MILEYLKTFECFYDKGSDVGWEGYNPGFVMGF
jgi:hypothetical protein